MQGVWRWFELISPVERGRISLGEAATPLVRSRRIGPQAGLPHLFFKLETTNPTGSYKDRFAAVGVSRMLSAGKRRCIATSSGNTGSALAAYCAAAGVECRIAIVESAPAEKLKQMLAYGAQLFRVRGFGLDPEATRDAFAAIQRMGGAPGSELLVSAYAFSPEAMTGVQTISYELAGDPLLADGIDHVFCPAGGGGLTLAVARGFSQLADNLKEQPRIECVQPRGNDTIAGPLCRGEARGQTVKCTSAVSGLQVPNPIDADEVIRACRAAGGTGHIVSDEQVWEAQQRLAREEGVFCEPAGAVALAAALQARTTGYLSDQSSVVCLVTGSGFKDAKSLDNMITGIKCPLIDIEDLERRAAQLF